MKKSLSALLCILLCVLTFSYIPNGNAAAIYVGNGNYLIEGEYPDNYSTNPWNTTQTKYRAYSFSTASGGYAAGINKDQWGSWNLGIENTAEYRFSIVGSTPESGCLISLLIDNNTVAQDITLLTTASYSPANGLKDTALCDVTLLAGSHVVKVVKGNGGYTFDCLKIEKIIEDESGMSKEAEDYNLGGQSVGYFDVTSGVDTNGNFINRGDDVEVAALDTATVVTMLTGEWLKYDVYAANAGYYYIDIKSATSDSNAAFEIASNGDIKAIKTLKIGSSQDLIINRGLLKLDEGANVIKIKMLKGSANFDSFELVYADGISSSTNAEISSSFTSANSALQVYTLLKQYQVLLGIDVDAETVGLLYPAIVNERMSESAYSDIVEVANKFENLLLSELTNPSVVLYDENGMKAAHFLPGHLTLKVNTESLVSNALVVAAIYNGNKLFNVAVANSEPIVTQIDLGEMDVNNADDLSFKLLYLKDLSSVQPYKLPSSRIYVSPNGNDSGSGTSEEPVRTIAKAQELARIKSAQTTEDILINIGEGEYFLSQSLTFTEADNHQNGGTIIYKGAPHGKTILNGGKKVENWTQYNSNLWKATLNDVTDLRQFYINGLRAKRARGSSTLTATEAYDDISNSYSEDGFTVNNSLLQDGLLGEKSAELVWDINWTRQRAAVSDIISAGGGKTAFVMAQPYYAYLTTKTYQPTRPQAATPFIIENAFALLDSPGEFYFNKTTKELFYYPRSGEVLNESSCYVGQSEGMLMINGSSDTGRVRNMRFEGLTLKYGTWLEPNTKGAAFTQGDKMLNSLNEAVGSGGKMMFAQVQLNWAENITFEGNILEHLGSAAVSMKEGVRNCTIIGNVIRDTSAGAVIGGDWNHTFTAYNPRMFASSTISNNYIRNVAGEYGSTPAISLYYVKGIVVSHNDIADTAYSGISLGWGWGANITECSNNNIEYNKVDRVMTMLADGANVYTLGPIRNSFIRGNYFGKSSDRGTGIRGGIYLDQGSGYLSITGNVIEQSEKWLFARANAGIRQVYVGGNYSDTANYNYDAANVTMDNNLVFTDRNWPLSANEIIANSGLEVQYSLIAAK